jgi:hypothetical protein
MKLKKRPRFNKRAVEPQIDGRMNRRTDGPRHRCQDNIEVDLEKRGGRVSAGFI